MIFKQTFSICQKSDLHVYVVECQDKLRHVVALFSFRIGQSALKRERTLS